MDRFKPQRRDDAALEHLCTELTATETKYSGHRLAPDLLKSIPMISAEVWWSDRLRPVVTSILADLFHDFGESVIA